MAVKLHIDNWITRAEPDFYTMFIKAWIPFNAWYVDAYPEYDKVDKPIINKLKESRNKIRNRIESLLDSSNPEAIKFCYNLAQLHIELKSKKLEKKDEIISFETISPDKIKGSIKPVEDKDELHNNYQVSFVNGLYRSLIMNGETTILDIKMNNYDLNIFLTNKFYVGLPSDEMKEKIRLCFEKINPDNKINLVSTSNRKSDYIELDISTGVKFIDDKELIAKSVIQILYDLRCMLFHGELDPTNFNQPVYEYAFNVLRLIIKIIN